MTKRSIQYNWFYHGHDRMLSDAQPCIYYLQSSVTGTRPSDGNYNKQISVTFYY